MIAETKYITPLVSCKTTKNPSKHGDIMNNPSLATIHRFIYNNLSSRKTTHTSHHNHFA
ncbi:hypothetical protein COCSADRAFT_35126 [Bipolaris sorokiniana ND90Pr]|uniref:Uncharacterized protein n=1 Tax=Cochliobolus sativus (strain ND90Pr / ATCC 201652) TaxID=665912 RepID=M2SHF1_COCSN|nr:uncharacterized protein COCSADRAFT_35126 [Bipolaris sorokiniana ND90Pr]EMD66618.1 hypothetical protein COCSADRAFT_35126 [Bipolaris sorokiniana ND90Pr]